MLETLIPFILILVVLGGFIFFSSRSEKKRETKKVSFVEGLQRGDKVVTHFGLHGTIDSIGESTVVLKMLDGKSMLRVEKVAIEKLQTEKV